MFCVCGCVVGGVTLLRVPLACHLFDICDFRLYSDFGVV